MFQEEELTADSTTICQQQKIGLLRTAQVNIHGCTLVTKDMLDEWYKKSVIKSG